MSAKQIGLSAFLGVCLALAAAPATLAQKSGDDGAKSEDPPKVRQSLGLPQISVIDKFLAAEMALGPTLKREGEEAWAGEYKSLYQKFHADANPGHLVKSRAVLALALGIKASDGVLALKGRDIEALNDCATQIEQLAAKLEVPNSYLERASIVKHCAKQQRWVEAFMQLGILQQHIMRSFESHPEQKDDAMLVVIGGWLQGGRCITSLIDRNYTPASSNILREPKLVAVMVREFGNINAGYKSDPVVGEVQKFLPFAQKKVDVGLRDPIAEPEVKALQEGFDRIVQIILKPAG